ncbi:MAG TPA: Ig-like domain-containing protein [Gemmatimonadaceae bacterium]|nr:Ig-like domain-containing protein [Gemmatimonadaceae bacterium]
MMRLHAAGRSLAGAAACLIVLGACSRDATAPGSYLGLSGAYVSAPYSDGQVFISLSPNGLAGTTATVVDARTGTSWQTPVVLGGFDPFKITAAVGDTLLITVRYTSLDSVRTFAFVPPSSKPKVVRTSPANVDSNVDVEDSILVVFSEPIDSATLAAGMTLRDSAFAKVEARPSLAGCESGLCARLIPAVPLAGFSSYYLHLSDSIATPAGVTLAQGVESAFETGAPTSWPTALGNPPLVVTAFSVGEFQVSGDTLHWYYAPHLTVKNTGDVAADAEEFDIVQDHGAIDREYACSAVHISPGETVDIFLEFQGQWDGVYGGGARVTTPTATAQLISASGGYVVILDLSGPIIAGQLPPTTHTDRPGNWSVYCGS